MKKRNVKEIEVTVADEKRLAIINSTFAIKTLFYKPLQLGSNIMRVNHAQYNAIVRMQTSLYTVKDSN
jgi:hypothetical protein